MPLNKLNLPAADGVDYNGGDVDYYVMTDPVHWETDNRPLKNLAYRDTASETKINEMIDAYNPSSSYWPHPQDVPDDTLHMYAGHHITSTGTSIVSKPIDFSSGSFAVVATGFERYDLVTINDSGVVEINAGTPVAAGTGDPFVDAPSIPTGKLAIAIVKVDEDTTVVVNSTDITDVREFLNKGAAGGISGIIIQDEGVPLGTVSTVNYVGAGVTAAVLGASATVTIPGGGGSGGCAVLDSERQVAAANQTVFTLTTITYDISHTLIVTRNGQVLNENEFTKTSSSIVTLTNAAQSGDILEFYVVNCVSFIDAVAWELFDSLSIGDTVLNLSFSYTPGIHHLFVIRNGAELIVDEPGNAGFAETSTTSVTLNTPIASTDERVVVYKITAVTSSLNHKMSFHDDAAEILAPGQTYRDLVVECSHASQVVIKQGSKVLDDSWVGAIAYSADVTVDITTSGKNGLDTGSEASNTWYYLYAIYNPTTTEVAGLLSASATAPTLPTGFSKKRLIGAVRNHSSSDFIQFRQFNAEVFFTERSTGMNVISTPSVSSWTQINVSNYVPIALARIGKAFGYVRCDSGGSDAALIIEPGIPSTAPTVGRWVIYTQDGGNIDASSGNWDQPVSASGIVSYSNDPECNICNVYIQGFTLNHL